MYTLSHDGASEYWIPILFRPLSVVLGAMLKAWSPGTHPNSWIPGHFLQKENSEDDKGGVDPRIFSLPLLSFPRRRESSPIRVIARLYSAVAIQEFRMDRHSLHRNAIFAESEIRYFTKNTKYPILKTYKKAYSFTKKRI